MTKTAENTASEITDLAGFLASRGGVADTFPQAGKPIQDGMTLMGARCQEDGAKMPVVENNVDFRPLVSAAPAQKLGG